MLAICAPTPQNGLFSSTKTARCVLRTVCRMASSSRGRIERRSSTSALMSCSAWSSSAALSAVNTARPWAMSDTWDPSRLRSATPSGIRYSSSGTSHFSPYKSVFSMNITGSLSRIADFSSPFASYAVAGHTTFMPGMFASQFSGVWECVAPTLVPPFAGPRMTMGQLINPPLMYLTKPALLTI